MKTILFSWLLLAGYGATILLYPPPPDFSKRCAEIRRFLAKNQPDSALVYADGLLKSLENEPDAAPESVALVLCLRGMACKDKGDIPGAFGAVRSGLGRIGNEPSPGRDTVLAELFETLALAYGQTPKADSCEYYHRQALRLYQTRLGPGSRQEAFVLTNLAGAVVGKGDVAGAIDMRLRSLAIVDTIPGAENERFRVCNNLAFLYRITGDQGKSMMYIRRAVGMVGRTNNLNPRLTTIVLSNYALFLSEGGNANQAAHQIDLAEDQADRSDTFALEAVWRIRADLARRSGRPVEASQYDRLVLGVLQNRKPPNPVLIGHQYSAIANDYYAAQQWDSCMAWFGRSVPIYEKWLPPENMPLIGAYRTLGYCYLKKGDAATAEVLFYKSLKVNGMYNRGPSGLLHFPEGISTCYALSEMYFNQGNFERVLGIADLADSVIKAHRLSLRSPESKFRLSAGVRPLYELGIEAAARLFEETGEQKYLAAAFRYSEQGKSLMLAEALRAHNRAFEGGVPAGLRHLEDSLKMEITFREGLRRAMKEGDPDIPATDNLLYALKIRYFSLLDTLKAKHEPYFNYRYRHDAVSTDSLSAWCAANGRAVVSYFVSNSSVFIFLFQKDSLPWMHRVRIAEPLDRQVKDMVEGISLYFNDSLPPPELFDKTQRQYADAAYELYEILFAPLGKRPAGEKVVIIPDGVLAYLPFDALLTRRAADFKQYRQLKYLGLERNMTYHFSATLLCETRRRQLLEHSGVPFLAFAPFSAPGDTASISSPKGPEFSPLPWSALECMKAANIMKGQVLWGPEATLSAFDSLAENVGILHLSTHGAADAADGDNSCVVLYGDLRLRAADICNYSFTNDLVVLSACQTYTGEWRQGEGVFSIARAFMYGGARRVTATLWSVKEKQTALLMSDFYAALKSGSTPDEALWEAKKMYWKDHSGKNSLPFFWAGVVLIGS